MNKKERLEELKSLIQRLKNAPYVGSFEHLIKINNPKLNKMYKIALEMSMSESDFISLYKKNSDCPKYNRLRNLSSEKQIFTPRKMVEIPSGRQMVLMFDKSYERYNYKSMPARHKDNDGIYVGNGGSNRNSVRYPSKKRSKKVWAKFYNMFPWYAERDNWDGQTSDRMK